MNLLLNNYFCQIFEDFCPLQARVLKYYPSWLGEKSVRGGGKIVHSLLYIVKEKNNPPILPI